MNPFNNIGPLPTIPRSLAEERTSMTEVPAAKRKTRRRGSRLADLA